VALRLKLDFKPLDDAEKGSKSDTARSEGLAGAFGAMVMSGSGGSVETYALSSFQAIDSSTGFRSQS
jgi:hypothetical protein